MKARSLLTSFFRSLKMFLMTPLSHSLLRKVHFPLTIHVSWKVDSLRHLSVACGVKLGSTVFGIVLFSRSPQQGRQAWCQAYPQGLSRSLHLSIIDTITSQQ